MEVICKERCLCIVEKKAEEFQKISVTETYIKVNGYQIEKENMHAVLCSDELRNITVIVKESSVYKLVLIFEASKEYEAILALMKIFFSDKEFSAQNNKINSYTNTLVEKLREGITLVIMEMKQQDEVIYCSECGMQCDPNIPYCMECGASI